MDSLPLRLQPRQSTGATTQKESWSDDDLLIWSESRLTVNFPSGLVRPKNRQDSGGKSLVSSGLEPESSYFLNTSRIR